MKCQFCLKPIKANPFHKKGLIFCNPTCCELYAYSDTYIVPPRDTFFGDDDHAHPPYDITEVLFGNPKPLKG